MLARLAERISVSRLSRIANDTRMRSYYLIYLILFTLAEIVSSMALLSALSIVSSINASEHPLSVLYTVSLFNMLFLGSKYIDCY